MRTISVPSLLGLAALASMLFFSITETYPQTSPGDSSLRVDSHGRIPARDERGEPDELFGLLVEAQQLFHRASNMENQEEARRLYSSALYRYERIARSGVRNAGLYYNIGNTYFRLGELGRSILYYRRALLLNPADTNVRHNLGYARSRRTDRIPPDQMSAALRVLFFWHYLLPPVSKLKLFVIAFGAAGVLGSVVLLLRRGFWRKTTPVPKPGNIRPTGATRWISLLDPVLRLVQRHRGALRGALAVCGVLSLVMLGSLVTDEIRVRTLRDGVITSHEVVARRGDGTAYQPSFVDPLHQGTEFTLLEERAGWYYIRLTDGRTCWIPGRSGELVIPDNVRASPDPVADDNSGGAFGRKG